MTKGALIIIMIYKTNINNNKDGGDENNKNTEHHSVLEVPHPKKRHYLSNRFLHSINPRSKE